MSEYPLYEVVGQGVIEIDYQIEKYTYEDGEVAYSWRAGDGLESDEWHATAEEAVADLDRRYGA